MKKTYNAPVAIIVDANPIQMIAESLNLSDTPADPGYQGGGDVREDASSTSGGTLWGNEW